MTPIDHPLMANNITREDLDAIVKFLEKDPILTQSDQVEAFESEWSEWLGVKYSVFVNSGSSANLLTLSALREQFGLGEIIVPTLTWVSDIASVMQTGFTSVFVDIDQRTLGMDINQVLEKITDNTKAVFLTHILGYNALNQKLLDELERKDILLIEDVCESHGATFRDKKLGSFGFASNFSFYYAHHLSTIEGGMICTNDEDFHDKLRMFRSHGMVREVKSAKLREKYKSEFPDLNPDFIFAYPAFNVRNTEINAVLGRSQLRRLDQNNLIRRRNLDLFLSHLNPELYYTDFAVDGSCNYAFTLVFREPNDNLKDKLEALLRSQNIEFRRGASGGGNQLRQPYARKLLGEEFNKYPKVNHIHFYGYYIGNYPDLKEEQVIRLCKILNSVEKSL